MKTLAIVLLTSLLGASGYANADEPVLSSRSAGKFRADTSIELPQLVTQAEPVSRPPAELSENYTARAELQQRDGVANRHDQLFEIFEADVQTLADLDGDGYHHALNVFFDVDVSDGSATVYAKLYLSREGGSWTQYYTTDLFEIHIDDSSDAYEVETELLEGYRPGYYDVLVEIYSLDHAYLVASEVLDYHYLGKDVMIEDLHRDEPYDESSDEYYEEVHYSSGGGSVASLLLFLLIIQVVIAARGSLATTSLSPVTTASINKIIKTP